MTFERYLKKTLADSNWPDHCLRCTEEPDGGIVFYVHPEGKSGDTADFRVQGNLLIPMYENSLPDKNRIDGPGVGMPQALWLDEFGSQVWSVFGKPPYLVGSAMVGKKWRDVDVRLILDDGEYEALGLGDPRDPHTNEKWVSLVLAYSALGKAMTGLPIDFQIQQQTQANNAYKGPRSALGTIPLRMARIENGNTH